MFLVDGHWSDIMMGIWKIIPLSESNPTHAYEGFRSNPTLKSQVSLPGVKYHSQGQIPLQGSGPMLSY